MIIDPAQVNETDLSHLTPQPAPFDLQWTKVNPKMYMAAAFPFKTLMVANGSLEKAQSSLVTASGAKPLSSSGWLAVIDGQNIDGVTHPTPAAAMAILEAYAYNQVRMMGALFSQIQFGAMPHSPEELTPFIAQLDTLFHGNKP